MTVITITEARDVQAEYVHTALSVIGVDAELYSQTGMIGRGDLGLAFTNEGLRLRIGQFEGLVGEVTSFWNRRNPRYLVFPPTLHQADQYQSADCALEAIDGIRLALGGAFSVNPEHGVKTSTNKISQISEALACGFLVPETIITSDYKAVRAFSKPLDLVCVKAFNVYSWSDGGNVVKSGTSLLDLEADGVTESIGISPLIYQRFIEKRSEVRVVAFGEFVAATSLAMGPGVDELDWRHSDLNALKLTPVTVSLDIHKRIKKLMQNLGIRFGIFEFAVDARSNWWFLEVNQAGQFSWQEYLCPDVSLVEPFARYLASGDEHFSWERADRVSELSLESLIGQIQLLPPSPLMSASLPTKDPRHRPVDESDLEIQMSGDLGS